MSDTIGRIPVPSVTLSTGGAGISGTQVFPLVTQPPYGFSVDQPVIVHRFGGLDSKQEQRYAVGVGPRKFAFKRPALGWQEAQALRAFWESMNGPFQAFTYTVPNADGTTTQVLVTFEQAPLSLQYLVGSVSVGFNLIEAVNPSLPLTVSDVNTRFPGSAMTSALLSEVQQFIPLIHIRPRETAVPDIYLSDRRVTLSGSGGVQASMGWASTSQTYLPRLVGIGEQGSDVILAQDIKGTADNVRFQFANADRVMTQLCNDTDLTYASIDWCLYHVNSGIVLQLWKGVIQKFSNTKSEVFPVQCSDGFFQIMNQYPPRIADRQCWKKFNDGVNCPYATKGFLNNIEFPSADPTTCDYYLESANGCQAHGMWKYFGGQQADPQGVTIKDDSTGFLGFGRNVVTATSIISDTIWGLTLPEIWCNSGGNPLYAFMAQCLMVDYRDESTYADSLGIIGAGPLGQFTASMVVTNADGYRYVVCPTVDGYNWQGFKLNGDLSIDKYQPGFGLRYIQGTDPAGAGDSFSLGQGTPQVWQPDNFAAGVAACEIRIQKSSTIQPSTPDQHQMIVPVDYGMWGWTWDAGGTRHAVQGLVNPFWIAVNMLLRALGIYGDPSTGSDPSGGSGPSSASQLAMIVLPSLVVGDGTGAAEIAGATVPVIVGSGTETQFAFQGSINGGKPLRQWWTEVLEYALGYYTFEFGKLRLGCRINASATDAYTPANTVWRSLTLDPIAASFEKLVLSFADVNYAYQANTATYADKDHAIYYGRGGSLLKTDMHSAGCSSVSTGLRYAATRTREEVGGCKPTEWRDARVARWTTSLLGLGNSVGQVASQTDVDIPGLHGTCNVSGTTVTWASGDAWNDSLYTGSSGLASNLVNKDALINGVQVQITAATISGGNVTSLTVTPAPGNGSSLPFRVITADFRIQRWSLRKDWSVLIEGQTVCQSMYDLDQGPKPIDVAPAPMPPLFSQIPFGPVWAPYQVHADAADALFPGEWTFDSDQEYTTLQDGTLAADILTGKIPVNEFSPGAGAPGVGSVSQATTGGSLPASATLWAAVCAIDANGLPSAPSNIIPIGTSASGTDTFTLADIVWPAVSGLASYVLFIGTAPDLICRQATGTLTGSGVTYTPNSITFGAAVERSTWALPSPYVKMVRAKVKLLRHSGVAGVAVTGVATNTITSSWMIDVGGAFNPVGRQISVIGRSTGSTPFASFNITAFSQSTGAFTVDRDPTGIVQTGDAIVIRNKATSGLTGTPAAVSTVTDSGYQNIANGYSGLTADSEKGKLIRVIAKTGRGQAPSLITGNTSTSVSFQPALLMDNTSVWIIEEQAWSFSADSTAIDNADPLAQTEIMVPTANFIKQSVLIAGFTVDVNGNESPDGDQPIREDWIYGSSSGGGATGGASASLTVGGILAIGSAMADAPMTLGANRTATGVTAVVGTAPIGAPITLNITLGGALWMTLVIAAGTTTVSATGAQISAAATLTAATAINVDLTEVGVTYPGADLGVSIF